MPHDITHILISLLEVPETGGAQLISRMTVNDRNKVTRAAECVGMSQQHFIRTVLVAAAEKVLSEAGVEAEQYIGTRTDS